VVGSVGATGGVEGMASPVGGVVAMDPMAGSTAVAAAPAAALSAGMAAEVSASAAVGGAVVSVFWQAARVKAAPMAAAVGRKCYMSIPWV